MPVVVAQTRLTDRSSASPVSAASWALLKPLTMFQPAAAQLRVPRQDPDLAVQPFMPLGQLTGIGRLRVSERDHRVAELTGRSLQGRLGVGDPGHRGRYREVEPLLLGPAARG